MTQKDSYQSELFANRLAKRYKQLRKWARKERITCYRLYDRDIPEIPVAADLYEVLPQDVQDKNACARYLQQQAARESENDHSAAKERAERLYLTIFLYERPYQKARLEVAAWLEGIAQAACRVLGVERSHIIIKMRRHDKGGSQYAAGSSTASDADGTEDQDFLFLNPQEHGLNDDVLVQEQGQLFKVNLTRHLDTGLFFDHRPLRALIRDTARGKSVLNLYCYTASFSVYAAEGNAKRIDSVDLSNTYLAQAEENMKLNGFPVKGEAARCRFIRADVKAFLEKLAAEPPSGMNRYDIIILDPPTFSNSKMTRTMLDINRDWPELVGTCLSLLTPGGVLYFSTNSRKLVFNPELISGTAEDITSRTLPEDYKGAKPHRCWKITGLKPGS